MTKVLLLLLAVGLSVTSVAAQTVNADRFNLKAQTPNCTLRSGEGPPATTADCDIVVDVKTGMVHVSGLGSSTAKVPAGFNAGDLVLGPQGDLILNPGRRDAKVFNNVLPGTSYFTQLGAFNRKFLTLHAAELWVETLVAQQTLATIGGRIVVAPTTTLTRDVKPGDTTIYTKHNSFRLHVGGVTLGSTLLLESNGKFESMVIVDLGRPAAQPDGSFAWSVQRNYDGSGPAGGNSWFAGDAILDTGVAGDGFMDIYSVRQLASGGCQEAGTCPPDVGQPGAATFGPTVVGNVRTAYTPWNAFGPRWALGNLNGLGYGFDGTAAYGVALGTPGAGRLTIVNNAINMYDGLGNLRLALGNGTASFIGTHSGDGSGVTNIQGGNIATETITAGQIQAGAISTAKLSVGVGKNLVQNSECRAGTQGWSLNYNTVTVPAFGTSWLPWRLDDGTPNVCMMYAPGVQPADRVVIAYGSESSSTLDAQPGAIPAALPIQGEYYAVTPGKRYEASMYMGNHRFAYTQIYIFFERLLEPGQAPCAAGGPRCPQVIWTPGVSIPAGKIGGTSLAGYERGGFFATAPEGATRAKLYIQGITAANQDTPYMFFTRMYFGEATANQTELSEWSPAGRTIIDGATIMTGSIRATHIAADQITTRELAANAVYADNITAGQITAGKLAARAVVAGNIEAGAVTAGTLAAGAVTTGTLAANAVTAGTVNADVIGAREVYGDRLDFVSADLGDIRAGGMVIGQGNTMWVNDTRAGDLAIGGNNKGQAPFYVRWDGALFARLTVLGEANNDVFIRARLDVGGQSQNSSTDIWNNVYIKKISGMGDVQVCADNDGRLKRCGSLLAAEDHALATLRQEVETLRQELALLRREQP